MPSGTDEHHLAVCTDDTTPPFVQGTFSFRRQFDGEKRGGFGLRVRAALAILCPRREVLAIPRL
jgi:hypothetical protein